MKTLPNQAAIFLCLFGLTLIFHGPAFAEELEFVTYYPAPVTNVDEVITDRLTANRATIGPGYNTSPIADGELFVEDRVGIGTDTPGYSLTIGSGEMVLGVDNNNITFDRDDAPSYINQIGTGDLRLRMGSGFSDVLSITNAGNVGIGTASPSQLLTIRHGIGEGAHSILMDDNWSLLRGIGRVHMTATKQTGATFPDGQLHINPWDDSGDVLIGHGTATKHNLLVNGDVKINGTLFGNAGVDGAKLKDRNSMNGLSFDWDGGTLHFYVDVSKVVSLGSSPTVKTFVINHPVDPSKHLVHGTLEGPEGAVYYRGTATLQKGRAVVQLPDYFEALTREAGRTIQLTNVDGFDPLMVQKVDGRKVHQGQFTVISQNPKSNQEFDWEIKAVRADVPQLEVEPAKSSTVVQGFGPHTYIRPSMAGSVHESLPRSAKAVR